MSPQAPYFVEEVAVSMEVVDIETGRARVPNTKDSAVINILIYISIS
jgi:hypothetical protein